MATSSGTVKKTPLVDFSRPRASGIIAVDLREGDHLIDVAITDGRRDVMLFSNAGKIIRFNETAVRPMGRTATGVRGIRLASGQRVVSLVIVGEGDVLVGTENGYGKRTPIGDFPPQGRGGQGVIAIQTNARNGDLVGAVQVDAEGEVMLITDAGTLVRTPVSGISVMGRNTQGVTLIRLGEGEQLVEVERIAEVNGETEMEDDEAT
jgi:DNA gyrase subunit A